MLKSRSYYIRLENINKNSHAKDMICLKIVIIFKEYDNVHNTAIKQLGHLGFDVFK